MTKSVFRLFAVLAAAAALAACATTPPPAPPQTKKLDAKTQLETGRTY